MDLNSSGSNDDGFDEGESSDSFAGTPRKGRGRGRGRGRKGLQRSISPITVLSDPQVGDIVWAKVKNHRWWPAILVNKEDCGNLASVGGKRAFYYVYWYGDGRVSPAAMSKLVDFRRGFKKLILPEGSRSFITGVYMAITEIRKLQMLDTDNWDSTMALAWAEDGFPLPPGHDVVRSSGIVSQHVRSKIQALRVKYEDNNDSDNEHEVSDACLYLDFTSEEIDLIHSVRDGSTHLEDICLACICKMAAPKEHPLFYGSICESCMEKFLNRTFSIGLDLVAFHCTICLDLGDMMVCSRPDCYRAYCCKCISMKATLGVLDNIREADPWVCFLCEPFTPEMHGLLNPRTNDWKRNMWEAFHLSVPNLRELKGIPLRVLCLDGSCDTVLPILSNLRSLNVKVDTLFLCNYSIQEMQKLHSVLPKNVSHVKSMRHHEDYETLSGITPVQIVIASSGAQDMESFGSYFFSFHNIMSMLNILNEACLQQTVPMMWVFEAAPPHSHDYNMLITRYLQFDPAKWFGTSSPKDNPNLVWTNIPCMWPFLEGEGASQTKKGESLQQGHCVSNVRRGRSRDKQNNKCKQGGMKRKSDGD